MMLSPKDFYDALLERGISFFAGVPDSLLKNFCAYITDNTDPEHNIITANEGNAVALASGYHLATGKIGMVYLQNAGQGNIVNPVASLTEVYKIPMLFMIGWRGEPGKPDEPQHRKQGMITLDMLEVLGIPYKVLPDTLSKAEKSLDRAVKYMEKNDSPYALVIRKETFAKYDLVTKTKTTFQMSREYAIKIIADYLKNSVVVSTTGKASRELFENRKKFHRNKNLYFLTIGSMGHCSQIALGIALSKPNKNVYCLDGDGSLIMHMGGLATIGDISPGNFKHIVLNNGAHDSVGGQPTAGFSINFPSIAKACAYKKTLSASTPAELRKGLRTLKSTKGPCLLEVKVNKGARKNLGRPTTAPVENKMQFMRALR